MKDLSIPGIQVVAAGNGAILDGAEQLTGDVWTPHPSEQGVWSANIGQSTEYLARDGERFYRYDDLGGLLAAPPSARLVLLNTGGGPLEGGPRGEVSLRSLLTSTAALLARQGIPAVLAMPYQITGEATVELFRALYKALAAGVAVDVAVAEARRAVNLAVANTVEWGASALFVGLPDRLVSSPTRGLGSVQAQVIDQAAVEVLEPKPAPATTPQEAKEPRRTWRPEREIPTRIPLRRRPRPAPDVPF